jgi:hypothetical protein
MFTVHGSWRVSVADTLHTIQADLSDKNYLRVHLDGSVIHESYIFWAQGEIYRFEKGDHTFVLHTEGFFRPSSAFKLFMDDREVGQAEDIPQLSPKPLDSTTLDVISEQNVTESTDIIDTETIPLDNLAGSAPLTTEKEVTKTVTNELSIQTDVEVAGGLKLQIYTVLEADLSAKLARQTGQKVGQTITERNKLTFTVQPQSSVTYTVIWKRKVRSGEYLVSTSEGTKVVPYRMYYGLLYQVESENSSANR